MSAALADPLSAFCERHGLHAPLHQEPAGAGRNSRVTRLSNADGQWILKEYGAPSAASVPGKRGHDRLGAEFAFLQYLQSGAIAGTAQPIAMDRELNCALYSLLPGERPAQVTADAIGQAAQFMVALNRDRATPQARALAAAADACHSGPDHLALTQVRLQQLLALAPQSALEEQARALVTERFMPQWQMLTAQLADQVATLPASAPILSPSDFGFHNALLHQGRYAFVDFEYAGWDDPVKLICDFICQPEVPITEEQGRQFIAELSPALVSSGALEALAARVALLLPVHRLKWCCLLLNEFRAEHRQRRLHAGLDGAGLLAAQLDKAQRYFTLHCGIH